MEKFARISEFEILNENDSKRLFGGVDGTSKIVSCTVVTSTANCTCNNNNPDSCADSGKGSECIPDPQR